MLLGFILGNYYLSLSTLYFIISIGSKFIFVENRIDFVGLEDFSVLIFSINIMSFDSGKLKLKFKLELLISVFALVDIES